MHVTGKGMLFVLKNPVRGTMKTVDVSVGGHDEYEIKGLSIKLSKMKDFFKGNYESKVFNGNDKLIGSSQSDTLAAYGNDTIKGGNGGDTIVGGNGNDKLYGESGGDLISGGKGNDLLDGGSGVNSLTGDAGNDTFHFSAQLAAGTLVGDHRLQVGQETRSSSSSRCFRISPARANWRRTSSSSRPTTPTRTAWSSTTRRPDRSRSRSTAAA